MSRPRPRADRRLLDARPCWEAGLGVLCPEGQADGVPCFELGADCTCCEHALTVEATRTRPRRPLVMESLAPIFR